MIWTVFVNIVEGSCKVEIPKVTVNPITTDDKDVPIAYLVDTTNTVVKISFSTYNCSPELKAKVLGGTLALNKWSMSVKRSYGLQSVEIVSRDIDGYHDVTTAPKVMVVAGSPGNRNKKNADQLDIDMYVMVPKDAANADLYPLHSERVAES